MIHLICVLTDDVFTVRTEPSQLLNQFNLNLPNKQFFEFSVESCSVGAKVALYGPTHESYGYMVVFGGINNDEIYIIDGATQNAVAHTVYLDTVSCDRASSYWIGWEGGVIQVGRGLYPHNALLEWEDHEHQLVTSLALTNWADNGKSDSPVKWVFRKASGWSKFH